MGSIDWPSEFGRTNPGDRTRTHKYDVTLAKAFNDLETQLERMDVDDHRFSTATQQRQDDGRPYANANPDDPSFVLRWSMDGQPYAIGCDAYTKLRDNVRTVGLYVEEKRKMSNRDVWTAESEFATAALPGGQEDGVVVAGDGSREEPHEVLGVAPDASRAVVKGAARSLKADAHPDSGGSREEFQRIAEAEMAMLDGDDDE